MTTTLFPASHHPEVLHQASATAAAAVEVDSSKAEEDSALHLPQCLTAEATSLVLDATSLHQGLEVEVCMGTTVEEVEVIEEATEVGREDRCDAVDLCRRSKTRWRGLVVLELEGGTLDEVEEEAIEEEGRAAEVEEGGGRTSRRVLMWKSELQSSCCSIIIAPV